MKHKNKAIIPDMKFRTLVNQENTVNSVKSTSKFHNTLIPLRYDAYYLLAM